MLLLYLQWLSNDVNIQYLELIQPQI